MMTSFWMRLSGIAAVTGRLRLWLLGWPRWCALFGGWVGIPLCNVWFSPDARQWKTVVALWICIWTVQIAVWIRDEEHW